MPRRFLSDLAVPLVAALPTSPVDGQVIDYLADGTNGVIWRLRYRAASVSPYKWEFVGGSHLRANVDTTASPGGTGGSYSELSGSPGPDVTVPLAGDYDVEFGAAVNHTTNVVNIGVGIAVGISAQPSILFFYATLAGGGAWNPGWSSDRLNGVTAGAVLRMRYQYSSIVYSCTMRRMKVRPIRVG